ncbi:hypothetical protein BLNAU_217 [Blattamonas nauphoetae]|uniref:Uncharacterized protein n=1 Tax=Blattamonas nauphoetae TaxID=2049346 RepID=A0ABQ9YME2_9EUKA|nr:hypothetical protein BLNAU_217 [Blattamonas nauphoetae]
MHPSTNTQLSSSGMISFPDDISVSLRAQPGSFKGVRQPEKPRTSPLASDVNVSPSVLNQLTTPPPSVGQSYPQYPPQPNYHHQMYRPPPQQYQPSYPQHLQNHQYHQPFNPRQQQYAPYRPPQHYPPQQHIQPRPPPEYQMSLGSAFAQLNQSQPRFTPRYDVPPRDRYLPEIVPQKREYSTNSYWPPDALHQRNSHSNQETQGFPSKGNETTVENSLRSELASLSSEELSRIAAVLASPAKPVKQSQPTTGPILFNPSVLMDSLTDAVRVIRHQLRVTLSVFDPAFGEIIPIPSQLTTLLITILASEKVQASARGLFQKQHDLETLFLKQRNALSYKQSQHWSKAEQTLKKECDAALKTINGDEAVKMLLQRWKSDAQETQAVMNKELLDSDIILANRVDELKIIQQETMQAEILKLLESFQLVDGKPRIECPFSRSLLPSFMRIQLFFPTCDNRYQLFQQKMMITLVELSEQLALQESLVSS